MKNRLRRLISGILSILIMTSSLVIGYSDNAIAADAAPTARSSPVVVVSLGDSYSSGEGIEPFYGQNKTVHKKFKDDNFLAHRSEKSWPALLEVPGIPGKMKDYNNQSSSSSLCKWYFQAASGAKTKHIYKTEQNKDYSYYYSDGFLKKYLLSSSRSLPIQLDVFNEISEPADYVTMTIGGNDVDFADIITTCALHSTYLGSEHLHEKINKLWSKFDTTRAALKKTYEEIRKAAGDQAAIIVAGYPKLLDKTGKGKAISLEEATTVNSNVTRFNEEIRFLVETCNFVEGMNIHYVDVETEFDKDGGHQAYSSVPWINGIELVPKSQDISVKPPSAYSVHPNAEGAKAYARCVNAKIAEIENSKRLGSLSGKICKASDRVSPVSNASISIYKDNSLFQTASADTSGQYSLSLPVGTYRIDISANGYIGFSAYATVTENLNTYMETFLLIAGMGASSGIASGTIKNALTGVGVSGVLLSVRNGWNNTDFGDIITTTTTDLNGNYSLTLPLGNYTLCAERTGYVSGTVNIIVQSGTTSSQNGVVSPIISGNNYRAVLTWGSNPSDLDSHVVGTLSSGSSFHVYYSHKSQYDGATEVCNLDVDDTTSYGPETITLKTTSEMPYYYYIYRYAGSGTVASSGAQVKLYQGDSLVATFNVPTDQGSGDYWNVFAIVNGELVIKNTISSGANTSYVN